MKLGIALYAEAAATRGALVFLKTQGMLPFGLAAAGPSISAGADFAKEHGVFPLVSIEQEDERCIFFAFKDKMGVKPPLPFGGEKGRRPRRPQNFPLHRRIELLFKMESFLKRAGCTHVLGILSFSPREGALPQISARWVAITKGKGGKTAREAAAFGYMQDSMETWLPSLLYLKDGARRNVIKLNYTKD